MCPIRQLPLPEPEPMSDGSDSEAEAADYSDEWPVLPVTDTPASPDTSEDENEWPVLPEADTPASPDTSDGCPSEDEDSSDWSYDLEWPEFPPSEDELFQEEIWKIAAAEVAAVVEAALEVAR